MDSTDRERIAEARDELQKLMSEPELQDTKLLVLANKQDLPSTVKISDMAAELGLPNLKNPDWFIQACSATTGEGLFEGLDWLAASLKQA